MQSVINNNKIHQFDKYSGSFCLGCWFLHLQVMRGTYPMRGYLFSILNLICPITFGQISVSVQGENQFASYIVGNIKIFVEDLVEGKEGGDKLWTGKPERQRNPPVSSHQPPPHYLLPPHTTSPPNYHPTTPLPDHHHSISCPSLHKVTPLKIYLAWNPPVLLEDFM